MSLRVLLASLLVASCASISVADKLPVAFNGKNLEGWESTGGKRGWFTVKDETLCVQNGPERKDKRLDAKKYKNFVIEFDFKFGRRNRRHRNLHA